MTKDRRLPGGMGGTGGRKQLSVNYHQIAQGSRCDARQLITLQVPALLCIPRGHRQSMVLHSAAGSFSENCDLF